MTDEWMGRLMASQGNLKIPPEQLPKFELQDASLDTWDRKYRLKSQSGEIIDQDLDDTYARVARALADVEQSPNREKWYEKFFWALQNGCNSSGTNRFKCRCSRTQTLYQHHQLYCFWDYIGFDERHPACGI